MGKGPGVASQPTCSYILTMEDGYLEHLSLLRIGLSKQGKTWQGHEGRSPTFRRGEGTLYGHEFGQAPGVGDGQQGLPYCSPCCHKESDTTDPLNSLNTFAFASRI